MKKLLFFLLVFCSLSSMAQKITDLTPATGTAGLFVIEQTGGTRKVPVDSITAIAKRYADSLQAISTTALATKTSFTNLKDSLSVIRTKHIADSTSQAALINAKQATLVSGTNIKTINGASVLGSGNITISGGGLNLNLASNFIKALNDSTIYFDSSLVVTNVAGLTDSTIRVTFGNGTTADISIKGRAASTGGGGSVAGSNTQIQYNNAGAFGASSTFTYNPSATPASKLAIGLNVSPTVTATADSDTLIGLDIKPLFPSGFVDTKKIALRVSDGSVLFQGTISPEVITSAGIIASGFRIQRKITAKAGLPLYGIYASDTLVGVSGEELTALRIVPVTTGTFGTVYAIDANGVIRSNTAIKGNELFSNNTVSANNGGIIIGEYSLPMMDLGGGVYIGRESSAGGMIPGSANGDIHLRTNAGIAIGNGSIMKSKFWPNGSLHIQPASGTFTQDASAAINVISTTMGSRPFPVMTAAQKTAIASPTVGLHIYQTDGTEGVYVYKSAGWTFAY